jgi:sodium/hydrogen antiporter
MLLNLSIFMWYGAVCPWASFRVNNVIPIYRLIFLGILILLFRRLPYVMAIHKNIQEIEHSKQALFVGFFGPIGVSAIFYLQVSLDFLNQVTVDGTPEGAIREDAAQLKETMRVVIWFLAICSIVVHGLSVPLGKLGYHIPRTMSEAFSSGPNSPEQPDLSLQIPNPRSMRLARLRRRRRPSDVPEGAVFPIGGSAIRSQPDSSVARPVQEPDRPIIFASGPQSPADSPADTQSLSPDHHPSRNLGDKRSSSDEPAVESGKGRESSPELGLKRFVDNSQRV